MKTFTVAVLVATLAVWLAACNPTVVAPQPGVVAPDFTAPTLDGQTVKLSDFRGRWVLINFWATWCPACRDEMPHLQAVHEKGEGEGLVLLAVNIGEGRDEVQRFMEQNGYTFPVPLDKDESIAQRYHIRAIPTSLFIDREGVIRQIKVGAFRNASEIWSVFQGIKGSG